MIIQSLLVPHLPRAVPRGGVRWAFYVVLGGEAKGGVLGKSGVVGGDVYDIEPQHASQPRDSRIGRCDGDAHLASARQLAQREEVVGVVERLRAPRDYEHDVGRAHPPFFDALKDRVDSLIQVHRDVLRRILVYVEFFWLYWTHLFDCGVRIAELFVYRRDAEYAEYFWDLGSGCRHNVVQVCANTPAKPFRVITDIIYCGACGSALIHTVRAFSIR